MSFFREIKRMCQDYAVGDLEMKVTIVDGSGQLQRYNAELNWEGDDDYEDDKPSDLVATLEIERWETSVI